MCWGLALNVNVNTFPYECIFCFAISANFHEIPTYLEKSVRVMRLHVFLCKCAFCC